MGKKCPYCGSTDTKISVSGVAGQAVGQTFRVAATAIAGIAGHALGGAVGHKMAEQTWEKMKPDADLYFCNKCKRNF